MRKITLSLLALVLHVTAYCGVPQAISYQAVALNASGSPIKNRAVALRLSIISGTPTGTVSYQERQTSTTDNSGIISVQIGNGSVLSGSFTGIDWSKGLYYLKTEIDTTAGTSYTTVGTVQFFSVPFAMYAASSGFASPDFPDGLNNLTPVNLNGSFSYIVPAGQTFYITDIGHNNSATCPSYGVAINGVFISSAASGGSSATSSSSATAAASSSSNKLTTNYPLMMPAGYAVNSVSCGTALMGFTIPTGYSSVVFDLSTGNYTVPVGKMLVIKNIVPSTTTTWNGYYNIGANTSSFTKSISFVDQGQTISTPGISGSLLMMGYLKNR
jgi:hypothetical protein